MSAEEPELDLELAEHRDAHLVVVEEEGSNPSAALCDTCEWATVAGTTARAQVLAKAHIHDVGGAGVMTTSRRGLEIYRPVLSLRLEELESLRAPFFNHPSRGNGG